MGKVFDGMQLVCQVLHVQGEGRAAIASKDLMLGEQLPPLTLLCKDSLGNDVPMTAVPPGVTIALKAVDPSGQVAELAWEAAQVDVDISADVVSPAYLFVPLFICLSIHL